MKRETRAGGRGFIPLLAASGD